MSTEFVSFLSPPGKDIKDYNRSFPPAEQPSSIHHIFRDSMYVREEVFVKEQHVPLERELDSEDQDSYHWVVYASVGAPKGQDAKPVRGFGGPSSPRNPLAVGNYASVEKAESADMKRSRSGSTATNLPVGVIRLVPPPDAVSRRRRNSTPHSPTPDSAHPEHHHQQDDDDDNIPHPTVFPGERYIRLGRLATLKDYRGLGLSRLLVNAALQYARKHPEEFAPPRVEGVALEEARMEGRHVNDTWKGLVYVHAQKNRTLELWKRYGFEVDEGMGTWDEEGMDHVGMYKRLEIDTQ
jgi:predicted GNAT family N-acyltransferase